MAEKSPTLTIEPVREIPFILRVIWFFLIGWHVTGWWILIAWLLNLTIIGLPIGLWMIHRVPQVLTLKARPGAFISHENSDQSKYIEPPARPFVIRAIYFLLIGWWFSLLWASVGYLLSLTIIGLPIGLLMLNRLPQVTTLSRG
jgi:uncharacterized membrane protein YccF (DUF307 family)